MPDAVTTQMEKRWKALTNAFADGQKDHELDTLIPSLTNESDQSVRLGSLQWIQNPTTGMFQASADSLALAHMWQESLDLDLSESVDGQVAAVRLFGREWADNFLCAILTTLRDSGLPVAEIPSYEGMIGVPLNGPRPFRVLCGNDVYPLLPAEGDENFEPPRRTGVLGAGQALIFSPGRFGPWLERLQTTPDLSWMPDGETAVLTASLRFYFHGISHCVLYGMP